MLEQNLVEASLYLEPEALSNMCANASMRTYIALKEAENNASVASELEALAERNKFANAVLGELS